MRESERRLRRTMERKAVGLIDTCHRNWAILRMLLDVLKAQQRPGVELNKFSCACMSRV